MDSCKSRLISVSYTGLGIILGAIGVIWVGFLTQHIFTEHMRQQGLYSSIGPYDQGTGLGVVIIDVILFGILGAISGGFVGFRSHLFERHRSHSFHWVEALAVLLSIGLTSLLVGIVLGPLLIVSSYPQLFKNSLQSQVILGLALLATPVLGGLIGGMLNAWLKRIFSSF